MVEVEAAAFVATASYCPTCRARYRTEFARCPLDGAALYRSEVDPLLGSEVSHYILEACIGEGGMGRVYRARHRHLAHRLFAVKVLIGDLAATVEMRMRFAHEADAASRLSHPNVVGVVDFGKTAEGVMFLAMELVEGRSLAEVIASEGPLAPPRAAALGRQILRGLEHAHESGLVHRDLKPDNVLVADEAGTEVARIVDFGLAIEADEANNATRLTRVGLALGTPVYAAPEQTHGESVDHRADLFAFGVTLYEMLAGVVPFTGSVPQLVLSNATGTPPPIAERAGVSVPIAFEAIVRRLMARDPDARYATARDVREALETAALPPPALVVAMPAATVPTEARSRWWIAVALLSIAGGVAAIALREPPPIVHASSVRPPPAPPPVPSSPPPPQPEVVAAAPPAPPPTRRTPPIVHSRPRVAPPAPVVVAQVVAPLVEEPAPVDAAPPAIDAPVAIEAPPPPPPPPRPPALLTVARVEFSQLAVRGSLADADVAVAIERVRAALRDCYAVTARSAGRSPVTTLQATFSIDASRRATDIAVTGSWPALASCARNALAGVRTRATPDVGDASVVVALRFIPEAP